MLRFNMAVPVTQRNNADFSSLGIVQAAVLGLTDPRFNTSASLQFIPNMDGFPTGRRLEDDVTRIELQAVAGVALAAIGLWYDDYTAGGPNPVTPNLLGVLTYTTGVEVNDTAFRGAFPYVQEPWSGTGKCSGKAISYTQPTVLGPTVGMAEVAMPHGFAKALPNPFAETTTFRYSLSATTDLSIEIYSINGKLVHRMPTKQHDAGEYNYTWDSGDAPAGVYVAKLVAGQDRQAQVMQAIKLVKTR
jgi:Domain of unknown function (DUF4331)/FlgD Ig-like domain